MIEITVVSPQDQHALTLIFLHAFSITAAETAEELTELFCKFPQVKFIFPQASFRPITAHDGEITSAWFDYLTDHEGDKEDTVDLKSVRHSRAELLKIIWRERRQSQVPVVLGGLSQGGCMALDIATRTDALNAVLTCVAHRMFSSRARPIFCPWFALSASEDDVFPSTWASCNEATFHTVAQGATHYLTEGEDLDFIADTLRHLLRSQETASAPVQSHP